MFDHVCVILFSLVMVILVTMFMIITNSVGRGVGMLKVTREMIGKRGIGWRGKQKIRINHKQKKVSPPQADTILTEVCSVSA